MDDLEKLKLENIDNVFKDDVIRYVLHNKYHIDSISELLNINPYFLRSNKDLQYWKLRKILMEKGLLLEIDKKEYESYGITSDVALIKLDQIDMSKKISNAFRRKKGIYFLGDILKLNYSDIESILYNDVSLIMELKRIVHALGYHFIGEKRAIVTC